MNSLPVSWVELLGEAIGLPEATPLWIVSSLGLILIFLVVILPSAAILSYLERKVSADFQARVGPNRAGPQGMLQPLADLIKLLQKEAVMTLNWRELLWLGIHTMALYSTVAVLPLGSMGLLVDTDMTAFLPFCAALIIALATMLLGFNRKSVPGWFGGVRVALQALAGAFPALVAILCAGARIGDFRWSALVLAQGASPFSWAIINPFEFIAFAVFIAGGMILLGVSPLDAGYSTSDIHGGVSAQLFGRRLTLFRFGRFYGFFLWCLIAVTIFLGAWNLPFGIAQKMSSDGHYLLLGVVELGWLLLKTFALVLLVVSVARVSPRGRADQVTDFSWKVLSPLSLFALIGVCLWVGLRSLV